MLYLFQFIKNNVYIVNYYMIELQCIEIIELSGYLDVILASHECFYNLLSHLENGRVEIFSEVLSRTNILFFYLPYMSLHNAKNTSTIFIPQIYFTIQRLAFYHFKKISMFRIVKKKSLWQSSKRPFINTENSICYKNHKICNIVQTSSCKMHMFWGSKVQHI